MRKGLLAGVVAGAAASLVMKLSDVLWQKKYPVPSYEDDITRTIGRKVAQSVGTRLNESRLECAALAVHFVTGTALGAGYGVAAELFPQSAVAAGIPFFVGEAVLGNELIGPKLGLFRPPREYPASKHWNSIVTHVVYVVAAELVRREVRRRL